MSFKTAHNYAYYTIQQELLTNHTHYYIPTDLSRVCSCTTNSCYGTHAKPGNGIESIIGLPTCVLKGMNTY